MDKALVEAAFSILPAVSGEFTWHANTLVFSPSTSPEADTTYTVNISKTSKDLSGNVLATPYTWDFSTAAPGDDGGLSSGLVVAIIILALLVLLHVGKKLAFG